MPQLTPVPSCPINPYACISAKATVTAANRAANATYQIAIAQVQAQLHAVQESTTEQTQQLLAWRPTVDLRATSIYGVLNLASQRFSTPGGDKWLILASDMQNNTNLDELPPDLTGVHILVLFLQTPDAVARAHTAATWTAVFKRAHVASIGFFDPAASAIMPSPWS
jgi:hypothetical protein